MSTLFPPMPYLDSLGDFADVNAMRAGLAIRYPAYALDKLLKLVIVGAAPEGARLIALCQTHGIEVLAVCDGDHTKHGNDFCGHVVRPIADAMSLSGDDIPIIIASHKPLAAVNELRALGAHVYAPFALLQVLHPNIFSPHMFYADWLEDLWNNRTHYEALKNILAGDVLSLRTLDAIIGFRLTMNVLLLEPLLDLDAFLSRDLVSFSADATYIDGGAFDGDTIRRYIAASDGQFSRIIAFEPDPITYSRLKSNFASEPRVEPMKVGLHRRKGILRFVNDASRAALLSNVGEVEVPVISIDEVLNNAPVSYIKLNIEGAEIEALEGARTSILRHHPILAISAYHAPDHLWRVPELIHAMQSDYQLHLRQQDGGAVETVIYAIPRK